MTTIDYAAFLSISLVAIYFAVIYFFGCKHHWELVDKTEMESRLETIMKSVPHAFLGSWEKINLSYRRVVLAMRCSKCGRARIHTVDSA